VFENGVLGTMFELNRDEVTGSFRKLHNEVLHNLYSSPSTVNDQVKEDETGGAFGTHIGEEKCSYDFDWNARRNDITTRTSTKVREHCNSSLNFKDAKIRKSRLIIDT
jgi:hypothetical protein